MYRGDYAVNATVHFMWNTFAVAGQSITRAVNGSIRIYKNSSTTQRTSAAGITDDEDFDAQTGLNHCSIDLSNNTDPGFYASGNDYLVVISAMTVDGKVINATIAQFSIENRSLQARIPAALVSGRMDSSVGAIAANAITAASIAADAITAAKIATDAIDGDALAASAVAEIQSGLSTAAALATVQADTDDIQARLPVALVGGRIDASVGAMAAGTVTAAAVATDAIDGDALAASAVAEIQSGLALDATVAKAVDLAVVQADTDNIQTRLPVALVGGKMDSALDATGLDATAVQEIWQRVIDNGLTAEELIRIIVSACAGILSGAATPTNIMRDLANTKNRITATCDASGNRTAVALDVTP